jgi:hypothetical protein
MAKISGYYISVYAIYSVVKLKPSSSHGQQTYRKQIRPTDEILSRESACSFFLNLKLFKEALLTPEKKMDRIFNHYFCYFAILLCKI